MGETQIIKCSGCGRTTHISLTIDMWAREDEKCYCLVCQGKIKPQKTSCTIIISHYESLHFLHACVRQIRRYKHKDVRQHIIVADQSDDETNDKIIAEFGKKTNIEPCGTNRDIRIVKMPPLYSGYGIDYIMRFIPLSTKYICQLHVDAFPIHKNWLWLPIKLIEENNFTFVGQLHFLSRPTDTIYPPSSQFFSMSPTFNVAPTAIYKEMSHQAGFTRFHQRPNMNSLIKFDNSDWADWAKEDYDHRGSDDDTVAFCWEDKYREHNKLGLAITGMIGKPPQEAGFGRIIEDMVFHFGFCRESVPVGDRMGENYCRWSNRIKADYTDELVEEMLAVARGGSVDPDHPSGTLVRNVWDGKEKTCNPPPEELNKRVEELKKE